jgi:site-specific DNA recombinase
LLKENRLKAVQNIKYRYLLRGLIRCGACGSTYSGTVYPGPGRENKGYYVCNGKTIYRGPHQKKCSSRNIDQMWIEDFIWGLSFIESTGKAIEEFRVTVEKYRTSSAVFEKETKMLTRSLQKLEAEKHHTLDYYRKGMLSLETITQSLRKIATEKDGYDLRLEEMNKKIASGASIELHLNDLEELNLRLERTMTSPLTFKSKREIIETLVRVITVETTSLDVNAGKKPSVKVTFKHQLDKRRLNNARHA